MFLARIDGTLTARHRHGSLDGCRFLLAQRLEPNGEASGEPIVVLDRLGAGRGSTVMVTTDGDVLRKLHGNTTPARLSVAGIVDHVTLGETR